MTTGQPDRPPWHLPGCRGAGLGHHRLPLAQTPLPAVRDSSHTKPPPGAHTHARHMRWAFWLHMQQLHKITAITLQCYQPMFAGTTRQQLAL